MKSCECGCGEAVNPGRRFRPGHNLRIKNPMDNPETVAKMTESRKGKGTGDRNSMKRQDVVTKNSKARSYPRPHCRGKNSPTHKPEIDLFIDEHSGRHFCKCGCGQEIEILRRYFYSGIPDYVYGHAVRDILPTLRPDVREKLSIMKKEYYKTNEFPEDVRIKVSCTKRGIPIDKFDGFASEERVEWRRNGGKEWVESVFKRDDHTCKECNTRGGKLNAHHILPFRHWKDPQHSLNIQNGITLCEDCHRETFGREYEFFSKYFDLANGVGIHG